MAVSAVATAALALVTALFVVAAFLQRGDLRDAARASMRAAAASEAGIALQQAVSAEQSRLTTYPALGCEVKYDEADTYMRLFNASALPAFDVDIVALAVLDEEEADPAEYVADHVKPDGQALYREIGASSEGFYGVYDRLTYDDVPPGHAVRCPLGFTSPPKTIHLLIQFRDLMGRNYVRLYWGYQSDDPNIQRYSMSIQRASDLALKETARIPFQPQVLPQDTPEEISVNSDQSTSTRSLPAYLIVRI